MPKTILVVEDEPSTRAIISPILEDDGYRVLEASDGGVALSVLQMIKPDLIVSDVMMPGMDGLTFYQQVRADDGLSHIPFIFLTRTSRNQKV